MKTFLYAVMGAAVISLISGCGVTARSLAPKTVVRNASGIYPIEAVVKKNSNAVLDNSIRTELVVWGQAARMSPLPRTSPDEPQHWTFSLAVPPDQSDVYYYLQVHYQIGKPFVQATDKMLLVPGGAPGKTYVLHITDRMTAGLDSERGRIGSSISILGKGFTPDDHVSIGGQLVPTEFKDSGILKFQVPVIDPDRAYPVEVVGAANDSIKVGTLLVDSSDLGASPSPCALVLGAKAQFAVRLPQPAPPGGVTVALKLSDPGLADLPVTVTVKSGKTEAMVKTTGRVVGTGTLTLESPGFHTASVPFSVIFNQ